MKYILSILLLFAIAFPAPAQNLPDAPTPATVQTQQPKIPLVDDFLLAGITLAAVGDSYTTHRFLEQGISEGDFPESQACHNDRVWIASLARAAAQIELTRILVHHHHKALARDIEIAHLAIVGFVVQGNIRVVVAGKRYGPSKVCSGW